MLLVTAAAVASVLSAPLVGGARAPLYGISPHTGLVLCDTATGAMAAVGSPVPQEAVAQELSSIDSARGVYYIVGYNLTARVANLVGLNVHTGEREVDQVRCRCVPPCAASSWACAREFPCG